MVEYWATESISRQLRPLSQNCMAQSIVHVVAHAVSLPSPPQPSTGFLERQFHITIRVNRCSISFGRSRQTATFGFPIHPLGCTRLRSISHASRLSFPTSRVPPASTSLRVVLRAGEASRRCREFARRHSFLEKVI